MVTDARPEPFLAIFSHTPDRSAWWSASQASHAAPSRQARTSTPSRALQRGEHLQVVGVVHDAEDVPERVDDRRGDPARLARGDRLVLLGAHGQQPLEGRRHVVDVPVHDRPARVAGGALGRVAAVGDAQLVLVVADAELDVGGWALLRADEVRLDAQQLGVPVLGRLHVGGPVADGGEPSQHRVLPSSISIWTEWDTLPGGPDRTVSG